MTAAPLRCSGKRRPNGAPDYPIILEKGARTTHLGHILAKKIAMNLERAIQAGHVTHPSLP
eukprot:3594726-Karenia_brevis.AAC.1